MLSTFDDLDLHILNVDHYFNSSIIQSKNNILKGNLVTAFSSKDNIINIIAHWKSKIWKHM